MTTDREELARLIHATSHYTRWEDWLDEADAITAAGYTKRRAAAAGDHEALIQTIREVPTREPGNYVDLADVARAITAAGWRRSSP